MKYNFRLMDEDCILMVEVDIESGLILFFNQNFGLSYKSDYF